MNDLRTALHDLSEAAGPATSRGHDLWARGRRARRTQRLATLTTVAAVVALVVALAGVARPLAAPGPADLPDVPDGGALPRTVHAPTHPAGDWIPGAEFDEDKLVTDLAVGPVSVAWSRGYHAPLLVSARTGEHLLVQLPDAEGLSSAEGVTLTLGPDGTRLAYGWWRLARTTAGTEAGIGVVDLRTGDVEQHALTGRNERPVRVEQISWSADGRSLAWIGNEAVQWDQGGAGFKGQVLEVGSLPSGAGGPRTWTLEKGAPRTTAVAATDDGGALVLSRDRLWRFPGRGAQGVGSDLGPRADWGRATVRGTSLYVGRGRDLVTLDVASHDPRPERVRWRGTGASTDVEPLGTTPSGSVVAVVYREKDFTSVLPPRIEVRAPDGRVRTLTTWDTGTYESVSVATDLADRPSVDFPAPRWPVSDERKAVLVALALGLVAALAYLLRGWLRRRRERP